MKPIVEVIIEFLYIILVVLLYVCGQKAILDERLITTTNSQNQTGGSINNIFKLGKEDLTKLGESVQNLPDNTVKTTKSSDSILDAVMECWKDKTNPNNFSIWGKLLYVEQWNSVHHYMYLWLIVIIITCSFLPSLIKYCIYFFKGGIAPKMPNSPLHLILLCFFIIYLVRILYYFGFKSYAWCKNTFHLLAHIPIFSRNNVPIVWDKIKQSQKYNFEKYKQPDIVNTLTSWKQITTENLMSGISFYTGITWTVLPLCSIQYAQRLLLASKKKKYQKDNNQIKFITINFITTLLVTCIAFGVWVLTNKWGKFKIESHWLAASVFACPFLIAPIVATVYSLKYKTSNELYCELQTVVTVSLVLICFVLYMCESTLTIHKWTIPMPYVIITVVLLMCIMIWSAVPSLRKPDAKTRVRQNLMPPKPASNTTFPTQFKIKESNTIQEESKENT